MARGLTVMVVLAAFIVGALTAPIAPRDAPAAATETLTLGIGDRVRVEGADIGCRVARLRQYGGRTFLDCRRAGPLAGTYATLLGEREVSVVRFFHKRAARVVFSASQEGTASRCA
jgi:hypothetical protein